VVSRAERARRARQSGAARPAQPPRPERSKDDILQAVTETLRTAERGLSDFLDTGDPNGRLPGLRNLIVFGRSVTNVLQNLRTPVGPAFDEWYSPIQEEMGKDELLKYFYRLRSEILKQGSLPIGGSSVYIEHLDSRELQPLMRNPPLGARGFFIGDQLGGSGWEVALSDGTIEKYYVALPGDLQVTMRLHFADPPTTHGGQPLADTSIEALAEHYVEYLRRLVREGTERFKA
jgi:hypothetical protein